MIIEPAIYPVIQELQNREEQMLSLREGGVLLMNKPLEWTSFDIVKYVRSRVRVKKVGHAGTLDPLASGPLILCLGKATKTMQQYQQMEKEYRAVIRLGASTASYDRGTPIESEGDISHISLDDVEKILKTDFMGEIEQVPPLYSALKVKGERLYKKARRGEKIELSPRNVTVYSVEITGFERPDLHVTIRCGKGTYIRSIAHDLGEKLGCKGHLFALERSAIGPYSVKDAWTPEQFTSYWDQDA